MATKRQTEAHNAALLARIAQLEGRPAPAATPAVSWLDGATTKAPAAAPAKEPLAFVVELEAFKGQHPGFRTYKAPGGRPIPATEFRIDSQYQLAKRALVIFDWITAHGGRDALMKYINGAAH